MSEVPLYVADGDRDRGNGHYRRRGTSLIRITPPAGPCSSPMPRDLW